MSRTQDVLNRLELLARKLGVSVEEALDVLEGKHKATAAPAPVAAAPVVEAAAEEPAAETILTHE